MHSLLSARLTRGTLALLLAVAGTACSMDKTKAPSLAGPSEFGLSIDMSATPDVLDRDGTSQSALNVIARDASGKGIAGQRFALVLVPSNGGTLSATEVVTGSDGRGTVVYTAAATDLPIQRVTVGASPVGGNFDSSRTQTVSIALRGAPAPVLSAFTFSPAAPKQFEPVTFDASGATLEGSLCGSRCVFTWTFGSEGSDAGEVVTHRFESPGTHVVTLVITGPDNVTTTLRKSVTVAEGVPPVAKFVVSPTDPIPGQTVFFSAAESAGKGGAQIVSYAWDFGNGSFGEGVSSSTTYSADGSYAVVLTVTDSNGLTTATSLTVSVKSPAAP